jgi:hypothetical protein
VIELQRYCRKNNKSHPKFVLLDTPLNAMKQRKEVNGPPGARPDKDQIDPRIEPSFWKSISDSCKDSQIIIVDNKEPPAILAKKLNLQLFFGPFSSTRANVQDSFLSKRVKSILLESNLLEDVFSIYKACAYLSLTDKDNMCICVQFKKLTCQQSSQ